MNWVTLVLVVAVDVLANTECIAGGGEKAA
jgi:hypothetical protein